MPRSKWKKEPQAPTQTRVHTGEHIHAFENGIIYNNISENYGSEKKITATDDNREKVKIKNKTKWEENKRLREGGESVRVAEKE